MNIAVTLVLLLMLRVQVLLEPVQAPCQLINMKPLAGVAVSVTWVPLAKPALQVVPQLIPDGELDTLPLPATVTDKTGSKTKFAVTEALAFTVTLQGPAPEHAPDHPVKVEPVAGDAESVTTVPEEKVPLQVDPQLMPAGALETVPWPLPFGCTVS